MYRFKNSKKVLLAAVLGLAVLGAASCSGKGQSMSLTLKNNLGEHELFKIGDEVCTEPEAMIIIANQKNRYEEAYTDEIWQVTIDEEGTTYEDYLLSSVRDFLAQMTCMNLMAKEYGVTLTDAETQKLEDAADEYYTGLSEADKEFLGVSREDVLKVYTEYYIANRLVDVVTAQADIEISDNEAKVITVLQILVEDMDTARLVLEKANAEGADFAALAAEYSKADQGEFQLGKGEMEESFEKAAFALSVGQISGIVETSQGYHVIACVSDYDVEATQENKARLTKERRSQVFKEKYDAFIGNLDSKFNNKLWETIRLDGDFKAETKNFYEIYNKYFEQQ